MRNGFASQHVVLDCIVHQLHDASCLSECKSIEELKNVGGLLSFCGGNHVRVNCYIACLVA